jgi:NADH:ubiquinone oxidoreductase subunit C
MIEAHDYLVLTSELFESWVWSTTTERPEPKVLNVYLEQVNDLIPVVVTMRVKRLGYLSAITCLDLGVEAGELEILYHFLTGAVLITLRVRVSRSEPIVPSLCEIVPNAEAFEREAREMFGVTFTGLRNPERLYLPDEWLEGVYPLRKDFDIKTLASRS